MKTTSRQGLVAALVCAVAFTITTQAQIPFAPDSRVSLSLPLRGSENLSLGAVTESSTGEDSASELNRKLTNPVSSIRSIESQFNNFVLNNGQWNNNWNFQPVMPVSLTKDWNLITRPVMPWYNIVPHETSPNNSRGTPGWEIWLCWSCCRQRTRVTGSSEPGLPPFSRPRPRSSLARANTSSGPAWW